MEGATINNDFGKISIGSISYTPTISGYKQIIVASSNLSTGSTTFNYGNNSTSITLSIGTITTSGVNKGGGLRR